MCTICKSQTRAALKKSSMPLLEWSVMACLLRGRQMFYCWVPKMVWFSYKRGFNGVIMRIKAMASALLATVLLVGCSGIDPVEQERRAVYEQQKKRDQAERAQRE